jgi:hypothetical protein
MLTNPALLIPSQGTGRAGTFRAHASSDLRSLAVGDKLSCVPTRFHYASDEPLSRLKTWSRIGGVVLAVGFRSKDTWEISGSAVVVAPGVALSAAHTFRDRMTDFVKGVTQIVCSEHTEHGPITWLVTHVRFVPDTDLCILSLSLTNGLPTNRVFKQASVTTRTPRLGERLFFIGYRSEPEDCADWSDGKLIGANVLISAGVVNRRYLGRRYWIPGMVIEVECETWGGMSGGPVFDDRGWLVGVLSVGTNIHDPPSMLSMAISALACPFIGGWPDPGPDIARCLLWMAGKGCSIERPEAVVASYEPVVDGNLVKYTYSTWQ